MTTDVSQIQHGWDVFGSDGEKVGDVSEVGPNYLLVQRGLIFTKDRYIPISAITGIEHDRVYLNVTKDQIETMGWDQPPAETGYAAGVAADQTTVSQSAETDYTVAERAEPVQAQPESTQVSDTETLRVPRYEEELQAEKTEREAGRVQVTKDVTEEERTLDVPVTREEVQVQSRTVDRPATDTSEAFQEGTLEVPVREEEVEFRKEPRVAEEVEISKQEVQETERVGDTVRREDVRVEETEGTHLRGSSEHDTQQSSERQY